jgi:nucleotide-binding universal stress UspA family protein
MDVTAPRSIVVGVDESPGAAEALRWAVGEAAVHEAPLRALMAWGYLDQHPTGAPFNPDYDEAVAGAALRKLVADAVGTERAATVDSAVVCDLPANALLHASTNLLVVGARGHGGFRGLLVGSVSEQVLHHTKVPTAVVRPGAPHTSDANRLVVGVDGSESSQRALHWAVLEATRRGASLDVVTAWDVPFTGVIPTSAPLPDIEEFEAAASSLIDGALAKEDLGDLALRTNRIVEHGGPARVLLDHAQGADLVIVGTRGNGLVRRALLGSIATQVVHHAPCAVVVVPNPTWSVAPSGTSGATWAAIA